MFLGPLGIDDTPLFQTAAARLDAKMLVIVACYRERRYTGVIIGQDNVLELHCIWVKTIMMLIHFMFTLVPPSVSQSN